MGYFMEKKVKTVLGFRVSRLGFRVVGYLGFRPQQYRILIARPSNKETEYKD